MTYPQYPGQQPQQQYPAQPGYYPPSPQYPAQQPPQGYYPPQPQAAPPAPVLARGTLEDYNDQPEAAGGGPSVTKFHAGVNGQSLPAGSWAHVRVTRNLNNTDVHQDTDYLTKLPKTFKDGTPKFTLWAPVQVIATSDPATAAQAFPEGTATLYVKGELKSAIKGAMTQAGLNADALFKNGEWGGADIIVFSAGEKPSGRGLNPTKLWQAQYSPGQGQPAPQAPQAVQAPAPVTPPAPVAYSTQPGNIGQGGYVQGPPASGPADQVPAFLAPGGGHPAPQAPVPAPQFQPPAPPQPPQVQQAPNLAEDKAALLARLQGQQG